MSKKFSHTIGNWPLFLIFLPLFYFLHGLSSNYAPLLIGIALKNFIVYSIAGIIIGALFYPLLKSTNKSALFSFMILFFNFFFAYLQDAIHDVFNRNVLVGRYIFLLPFFLFFYGWILVRLKRRKQKLQRLFSFLNITLLLLLFFESITLVKVATRTKFYNPSVQTNNLPPCDTCKKPDVYIIVADEYAGKQELLDIFSFDNTLFENELKKRGFHVITDSRSNYNQTIYSIASAFSMNYLQLNHPFLNRLDLLQSNIIINSNSFASFFSNSGYEIVNHSMFDFNGQKKALAHYYLPPVSEILTFQTFTTRLRREAGYNFIRLFNRPDSMSSGYLFYDNDQIEKLTIETALSRKKAPVLVYSHFLMPHPPYIFDSSGSPQPDSKRFRTFEESKTEYIQYLQYTNGKLLSLFDKILNSSDEKPIILFLSDHGFRQLKPGTSKDYFFMNIAAISLPDGNYQGLYPGISTVNLFRSLLNNAFGQNLPLLKDSTILVQEARW